MRLTSVRPLIAALLIITAPVILAAPMRYEITFSGLSGVIPTAGSFLYERNPTGDDFSMFLVTWNGIEFDLTGSANLGTGQNPSHAVACGYPSVGEDFSFGIMSGTCAEPNTAFSWLGIADDLVPGFYFQSFSPSLGVVSSIDAFTLGNAPGRNAIGSFVVSRTTPVPAPTPLLLLPLLAAGLLSRRGRVWS